MPLIDVSEVLKDNYVAAEPFVVVRRKTSVSTGGVTQIVETRHDASGAVQPTGDNSLVREEAFQMQANTIKVFTNFMLRGESKDDANLDYQPDLILWSGNYYLVKTVNEWSKYGVGMIEAECYVIDYRTLAPARNPAWGS